MTAACVVWDLAEVLADPSPAGCRSQPLLARRILVTGSRLWVDTAAIRAALAVWWHPAAVLVSGACPRGADRLAEACWTAWGGRVARYPADWRRYGHRAGFVRNLDMIRSGVDVCVAFIRDGSRGAMHCAGWAELAGVPVDPHWAA